MFEEYGGPVVRLLVSRGVGSSIVFTGYSSRILFRGHPQRIRINLSRYACQDLFILKALAV